MIQNIDVERNIIGSMLFADGKALRVIPMLTDDDFTNTEMRTLFSVIKALDKKNEPVDLITVDNATAGKMLNTLIEAQQCVVSSANIDAYVKILLEYSDRRKLIKIGENILAATSDEMSDTASVADVARAQLRALARERGEWTTMDEAIDREYAYQSDKTASGARVIKSGFSMLDKNIGGLFPGELTVIGARPSVGKSAFALNMAIHAAQQGKCVNYISLEMSERQNAQRVLTIFGADSAKLRTETVTSEKDWSDLANAHLSAHGLPILHNSKIRMLEDIRSEIQCKVDNGQCDMLIIDYLQKMSMRQKYESDRIRVSRISAELKNMALDFNIPIIALAQVRRLDDGKIARLPALDDLKDSGSIEQDADNVIFIHRVEDGNDSTASRFNDGQIQGIQSVGSEAIAVAVAKQRQGSTGIFLMSFDDHYRFHEICGKGGRR